MHFHRPWNRRRFLAAAGVTGATGALSALLPNFGAAADGDPPKRLLLLTHGNGTVVEDWRPRHSDGSPAVDGERLDALHSPILEPALRRHADKLIALDGIDIASCYDPSQTRASKFEGHSAAASMFTGWAGDGTYLRDVPDEDLPHPNGPSIDQYLASRLPGAPISSLVTQTNRQNRANLSHNICYATSGAQIQGTYDLEQIYTQLFGGFEADGSVGSAEMRRRARNAQVLTALRGDIARLRPQLPRIDQERLDLHVESLTSLGELVRDTALACTVPSEPPGHRGLGYDRTMTAHFELIRSAFACDRTRFVTHMLTPENWDGTAFVNTLPGWSRPDSGVHVQSHEMSTQAARDNLTVAGNWLCEKFAELLDMLSAPNSGGEGRTLLDDTLVVWGLPMSHAGRHTSRGTTWLLAQGAGGGFETNVYRRFGNFEGPPLGTNNCSNTGTHAERECGLDYGCATNNSLLVSICHWFGLRVDHFGDNVSSYIDHTPLLEVGS